MCSVTVLFNGVLWMSLLFVWSTVRKLKMAQADVAASILLWILSVGKYLLLCSVIKVCITLCESLIKILDSEGMSEVSV